MEVIKNENTVFFDVDGTLIDMDHNGKVVKEYHYNIDQIHRHKRRGYYVVVWSANGYQHAHNMVKHLGLDLIVDKIMTKPNAYFDDKDANSWMSKVFVGD